MYRRTHIIWKSLRHVTTDALTTSKWLWIVRVLLLEGGTEYFHVETAILRLEARTDEKQKRTKIATVSTGMTLRFRKRTLIWPLRPTGHVRAEAICGSPDGGSVELGRVLMRGRRIAHREYPVSPLVLYPSVVTIRTAKPKRLGHRVHASGSRRFGDGRVSKTRRRRFSRRPAGARRPKTRSPTKRLPNRRQSWVFAIGVTSCHRHASAREEIEVRPRIRTVNKTSVKSIEFSAVTSMLLTVIHVTGTVRLPVVHRDGSRSMKWI